MYLSPPVCTQSKKEKQDFIRYVWGQSRLPYNEEDFTMKFKIAPAASDNNGALPVSHTCFFTLDCPRYTSYEILREKLIKLKHLLDLKRAVISSLISH